MPRGMMRTRLMMREVLDIGSDKRSTAAFVAGPRNCMALVQYQTQTPRLLPAAATETAVMLSMQPCVCSPRRVPTPCVGPWTQVQPRHSLNVLTVSSTAMQLMMWQRHRTDCHPNCIHSHCTDGAVMPHMWALRHSLLDLPLRQTRN